MEDLINQPPHYTACKPQVEPIDLAECMGFNLGNAIKYLSRAGRKEGESYEKDMKKAIFYLRRENDLMRALDVTERCSEPLNSRALCYFYWFITLHADFRPHFEVRTGDGNSRIFWNAGWMNGLLDRLEKSLEGTFRRHVIGEKMKDNLVKGLRPEQVDRIAEFTHTSAEELRLSSEERIARFRLEALGIGIDGRFSKQEVQDEMNACEIKSQIWKERAEAWRIELERYREE